jgi:hypothetical protein
MGWEPVLEVWLSEYNLPADTCNTLFKYLKGSASFGKLFRVVSRQSDYSGKTTQILESLSEGILANELEQFTSLFKQHNTMLECWWETFSYHTMVKTQAHKLSCLDIVEEPWRIVINIFGSLYEANGHPNSINMTWELGSYKYISPKIGGELASLNILAVIYQISFLIEFGVSKIYAPNDSLLKNSNDSSDPKTFYLVYHKEPDGFRQDVIPWIQHLSPQINLKKEDIIMIVNLCEGVSYLEISSGILVFYQDLVDGTLDEFYSKIIYHLENCS